MSFTTVVDKSAGDVFTEAMWDTYIRDNLNKGVVRPIGDTILASSAASITFSSITTDYAHLFIELYARSDSAVTNLTTLLRLNADAGANYNSGAFAPPAGSNIINWFAESLGGTSIIHGWVPGSTATANRFGAHRISIPYYQSAGHKLIHAESSFSFGDLTRESVVAVGGGVWKNVAVINSITLLPSAGNFIAGTRATIYGMAN